LAGRRKTYRQYRARQRPLTLNATLGGLLAGGGLILISTPGACNDGRDYFRVDGGFHVLEIAAGGQHAKGLRRGYFRETMKWLSANQNRRGTPIIEAAKQERLRQLSR